MISILEVIAHPQYKKILADLHQKESANARLRETLTSHIHWLQNHGFYGIVVSLEAALAVPPAQSVATGRLSQSGTTANTDMAKATNRPPVPPEVEREAWLDGRARVKPEKEKP